MFSKLKILQNFALPLQFVLYCLKKLASKNFYEHERSMFFQGSKLLRFTRRTSEDGIAIVSDPKDWVTISYKIPKSSKKQIFI